MSSERNIITKLYESKSLDEVSFEANGSTYSSSFGKYYKDKEPISRDEYFSAKGGKVPSDKKSKEDKPSVKFKPLKDIDFSSMSNDEIHKSKEAIDLCYDIEDNLYSICKSLLDDGIDDTSSQIDKNRYGDVTFKTRGLIYPDAKFNNGRMTFGKNAGKLASKFQKSVEEYFNSTPFKDSVDVYIDETDEGYRYEVRATKYSED